MPPKANLSNPRSAALKAVQVTSDAKKRLIPTATLAKGTQNSWKPITHTTNTMNLSLTGKGKVFVKPKLGFKSHHDLHKDKENHKAPTRDQPTPSHRPGDRGSHQKPPISGNDSFAKVKWRRGDAADGMWHYFTPYPMANIKLASFRLPYEHRVFQDK